MKTKRTEYSCIGDSGTGVLACDSDFQSESAYEAPIKKEGD